MLRNYLLTIILFFSGNLCLAQIDSLTLNGTSVMISEDCVRLTQDGINNQVGSFYANEAIDLNQPFDMEFSMNFGLTDGNGADGMVFILQNNGLDMIGGSGGNIGYENSPDSLSLGVEFDTWQNAERGDPFFDHIGIISEGSTAHNQPSGLSPTIQMSSSNTNVEDGQDHFARIYWEPSSQLLSIDFDCQFRLSATIDLINDIFQGNNLVYWGFTSSTGGANNEHTVCMINNTESNIPEECQEAGTLTLTAAGYEQGTFSWEPAVLFDDPSAQSVSGTFNETTEVIVNYIHPCGISGYTDTITIYINDIEIDVSSNIIDCYSDTLFLDGISNDNEDIIYEWFSSNGSIIQGENDEDAIALGEGSYQFSVIDTISGCSRTLLYEAPTNFTAPLLTGGTDGLLSCQMPIVTIEMTDLLNLDDYSFQWNTQNGNIVSTNDSIAQVNLAGNYSGTMTYLPTGCSETIDILVENDPEFFNVTGLLEVPNIITPNGDNLNESLRAFYILDPEFDLTGKVNEYSLDIYNRWGNLVYNTSRISDSWEDFSESDGTFYYVMKYRDICDNTIETVLTGTVQVMR